MYDMINGFFEISNSFLFENRDSSIEIAFALKRFQDRSGTIFLRHVEFDSQ